TRSAISFIGREIASARAGITVSAVVVGIGHRRIARVGASAAALGADPATVGSGIEKNIPHANDRVARGKHADAENGEDAHTPRSHGAHHAPPATRPTDPEATVGATRSFAARESFGAVK